MDETNPLSPLSPMPLTPEKPAEPQVQAPATVPVSDHVIKFRSCRWRSEPDAGEFCTHRDVRPFAGKEGFVAYSWCRVCAFYKLRRQPKKRDYSSNY